MQQPPHPAGASAPLDEHDLARRIARLAPDKRSAFMKVLTARGIRFTRLPVVPAPRDAALVLSCAQERLFFLMQIEPASAAYNMPAAFRLRGSLDVDALQRSFTHVVMRHEALRTTFHAGEHGNLTQVVHAPAELPLRLTDLCSLAPIEREHRARALADAEARSPFDLSLGPPLRVQVLRLAPDEHVLLVTMHHVISDGWSLGLLTHEVTACYSAFTQGQLPRLPTLPIQYADFAAWQRQWLDTLTSEAQAHREMDYWRNTLGTEHPVVELPTDRPRPKMPTGRGARHRMTIEPDSVEALRGLARAHGATLFMVLLAACDVWLYRLTGQRDLRVGVPIAQRNRAETQHLIGCFINTQVLRTELHGGLPFAQLLSRVRTAALGAQAHQDLPFERLVEALQPQRDTSRTPLFQVMFNLVTAQAPVPAALPGIGFGFEPMVQEGGAAQFDLSLDIVERGAALEAVFTYSTDLFDAATVERFAACYGRLLHGVLERPELPIGQLPMLGEEEHRRIATTWNEALRRSPDAASVIAGFEAQVRRTPQSTALVLNDQCLSYAQLNARANRLAHRLLALGAGPELCVGICVERSIHMVVGLLAVLKAGAAYVPLDPDYPDERLAYMVEDAGIRLLLVEPKIVRRLKWLRDEIRVLDPGHAHADGPVHDPGRAVHPEQLAYLMYTSGSTGRPKGVGISHASLAGHAQVTLEFLHMTERDRVLQFSTFNFDGFVEQLYPALLCGAAVVLRGPELWDGEELRRRIVDHGVTVADLTTAYWSQVVQDLAGAGGGSWGALRVVSVTGEAMPPEGIAAWRTAGLAKVRLLNTYGPTEATVTAMLHDCAEQVAGTAALPARMPIGRGLDGRGIYVLDRDGNAVPAGVPGELCIGGPLLARGYHARPALTAERFVPDPFGLPGSRLYRSGDLARWDADGVVDCLGRIDHQVKLRGFRIELGEIEARLLAHPAVRQALVLVREDVPGDKRLVAYLVVDGDAPSTEMLRAHLKAELPPYMLPGAFIVLQAFPLNANGKLDRGALPAPQDGDLGIERMAPRTPAEALLLTLWRELLGRTAIGIRDNFFELGGHSLLATRLVSRIRRELGCELPLRALFEAPTIEELALRLAHGDAALGHRIPAAERSGPEPHLFPLSFAQQRLWFLHRLEPHSAAYNIPACVRLVGTLDVAAFRAAFEALVQRHEALRTSFHELDGEPRQRIAASAALPLRVIDLRACEASLRDRQAHALIAEQASEPFDLSSGPLLRLLLVQLDDGEHLFSVTMHHVVSDGWSMGLLVREFAALYTARVLGRPAVLPDLPVQYADFAVWQREWLAGAELQRQAAYWKGLLGGNQSVLELPADRPRPMIASGRGGKHRFVIDAAPARRWQALLHEHGATLFMGLLAVFDAWLYAHTGRVDTIVGTDIANRHCAETEHTVGFFVNQLALRADLHGNPSFTELLARTRQRVLDALAHQDLPFDKLVELVNPVRGLAHAPLFQVKLVLQNQDEAALELPQLQVLPQATDHGQVQLDLLLAITEAEAEGGLKGVLEYSSDLFDADTAQAFAQQMAAVLDRCASEPSVTLDALAAEVAEHARRFRLAKQTALGVQARARLLDARRLRRPSTVPSEPIAGS